MKKKNKIMLIILLIIVLTIHISLKLSGTTFADNEPDVLESIEGFLGGVVDGVLGLFLLRPKFYLIILGGILGLIMGFFAEDSSLIGLVQNKGLTLEEILFNKVQLLDINFFNFSGDSDSTSYIIKENIAIWYTSIRNIAIVVLAIIAIYVGIRMAMSTIAEEKAKYKTMLTDWLTSLALVFLLHYIMLFVININNAFVNVLSNGLSQESGQLLIDKLTFTDDNGDLTNKFLYTAIKSPSFITGMSSALIYVIFQILTFIFLLTYLKRMITIAFLIVISPIVTITYSIDKMGDGRSQALNIWFKEFVYNILIQPFHCVAYLVLGTTALKLMTTDANLLGGVDITQAVLAVAILIFIFSTEKIVKKIFHFESDSMADVVAGATIAGTVVSTVMSGAKKAKAGGGTIMNFANQNPSEQVNTTPKQQNANNIQQVQNTNKTQQKATPQMQSTIQSQQQSNISQNTVQANKKQPNILERTAKKALSSEFRRGVEDRLFTTLVGSIPGIVTQNTTATITGGVKGYEIGSEHAEKRNLKNRQIEMAKAVSRYKEVPGNENISLEDLTNNALEFADGTKIARTEEEIDLRDAMQRLQIQYARQGLDEKKIIKQSRKVVKEIENGFISPITSRDRYIGKIKQVYEDHKADYEARKENRYNARNDRETKDGRHIHRKGDKLN